MCEEVRRLLAAVAAAGLLMALSPRPADAQTAQQLYDRAEAAVRRHAYDEAIALYTKALDASPSFLDALRRRGAVRRWAKAFAASRADLDLYVTKAPLDPRGYASRADLLLDMNDAQAALRDADTAILLEASNVVALNARGRAHSRLGQREEALADYTIGILVKPDDAVLWSNRGFVRRDSGDREGAMRDFEKALAIDPGLANARRGVESLKIAAGTSAPPPLPGDVGAAPALPPPPPLDPPGPVPASTRDSTGAGWSPERREAVVLAVLRGELTAAQAAERNGLGLGVVARWRDAFVEAGRTALQAK